MSLSKRDTFVRWVDPKHMLWEDANGHVHFSIVNALKAYELEDTPENRGEIVRIFKEIWKETHEGAEILYRQAPDSPEFWDQKGVE